MTADPCAHRPRGFGSALKEAAAARGLWGDLDFLEKVAELNPRMKQTQFADYHGHGWVFRAVFKKDKSGNLLTLDDDVVIGAGVHLSGHTVEGGWVKTGRVCLGRGVTVGLDSIVEIDVDIAAGCLVGAMSFVPKHTRLTEPGTYVGVPAHRHAPSHAITTGMPTGGPVRYDLPAHTLTPDS